MSLFYSYKSTNSDAEAGSRPERLWKAVKDGKSKTITEILEKPFVRTAPAVPLVKLTDDAGSVFVLVLCSTSFTDAAALKYQYQCFDDQVI